MKEIIAIIGVVLVYFSWLAGLLALSIGWITMGFIQGLGYGVLTTVGSLIIGSILLIGASYVRD